MKKKQQKKTQKLNKQKRNSSVNICINFNNYTV